jgi:hypothetical protein
MEWIPINELLFISKQQQFVEQINGCQLKVTKGQKKEYSQPSTD